jgi:hypothetical protein
VPAQRTETPFDRRRRLRAALLILRHLTSRDDDTSMAFSTARAIS